MLESVKLHWSHAPLRIDRDNMEVRRAGTQASTGLQNMIRIWACVIAFMACDAGTAPAADSLRDFIHVDGQRLVAPTGVISASKLLEQVRLALTPLRRITPRLPV